MDADAEAQLAETGSFPAPGLPVPVTGLDLLVRRVLDGDHEAFAALMAETEGQVLGLSWRLLGDRDQAMDAAQETYLRVFRSLERYRLGEDLRGWIHRITLNVCFDHMKRRGPRTLSAESLEDTLHQDHGDGSHHAAEESVLLEQRRALLQRALGTLSPAERIALVLRDLQGLSTEEAARTLGVRPVTVRTQICAARGKIQAFCARLLKGNGTTGKGGRP